MSFGQMISTEEGGMNDICAFNAASSSIKTQIANNGAISADDIHNVIEQANKVVNLTREHFPGSLGSSEILRRVRGVLDEMGVENILLTQSGKFVVTIL